MNINDITYQIRGAIFEVYNHLGPGLLESVYEEALSYELTSRGLSVKRQQPVPLLYKGQQLHTELFLDILVEEQVIIELKSVAEMKDVFFKQTLTYLRLSGKHIALLVNFKTNNINESIFRIAN